MGMHEEQQPKSYDEVLAEALTTRAERLKARPLGHGEIFTVVYCMPDGNAIIRYERVDPDHPISSTFLGRQAFAVIKVIPSINGSGGGIEFLRSRFDVGAVMQNMADSYLKTNDETPRPETPKTFPIND